MMKVVVLTMYSKEYAEIAALTLPNMAEYADRHGYNWEVMYLENGEKWPYKKHEMIAALFNYGFDVIWYRDIDAIITNINTPITSFIDDAHSLFLTKDFNEINGGSLVIKNTMRGKLLNGEILYHKDNFENEQNCINHLMGYPYFSEDTKLLPHPSINSYDYSLYKECSSHVGKPELGDWEEGHLLLHVPGLSLDKRLEVLRNAKITR